MLKIAKTTLWCLVIVNCLLAKPIFVYAENPATVNETQTIINQNQSTNNSTPNTNGSENGGSTASEKNLPLTVDETKIMINQPQLQITIPGLKFSDPEAVKKLISKDQSGTYLSIPYLSQYIVAIYKYIIVIASIIATFIIMWNGFDWLFSIMSADAVQNAKKRIGEALVGLLLALLSYNILNLLNPYLVNFQNLKIKYINRINLGEVVNDGHTPELSYSQSTGTAKPITSTQYDNVFQSFAACVGIDWRILKAVSFRESGLNPGVVNKLGYTGLFQTLPKYCPQSLYEMKLNTSYCDDPSLKNPAVNTAVGVNMIKYHLKVIEKKCSNASVRDKAFMIYFGNANGTGGLEQAISTLGCTPDSWPDTTFPAGTKYKLSGKKVFLGAPRDYTFGTADLIMAQGVTSIYVNVDKSICPSQTQQLPSAS